MVKEDTCLTSYGYLNIIQDTDIYSEEFSLDELESKLEVLGYTNYWNYPLNEIDHIVENDLDVVLVRFPLIYGDYEYRWCEIG